MIVERLFANIYAVMSNIKENLPFYQFNVQKYKISYDLQKYLIKQLVLC